MAISDIVNNDRTRLFSSATPTIFNWIKSFPGKQVVIAICGGRSVGGLLTSMLDLSAQLPAADWQRLQFFMVDERLVPLDHPDSNFGLVRQLFFSRALHDGLIKSSQIHPFIYDETSPDLGIRRYRAELSKFGGNFDIVFLGVGEDGHIAGIFPHGVCFPVGEAAASTADFLAFDDSPKPPPKRMTSTPQLLARGTYSVGMFLGEDKRQALETFRGVDVAPESCPAKLLNRFSETLLLTDLVNS